MYYGSETWCLGQNEVELLKKVESICGVKLIEKKSTKHQIQMLDLDEAIGQLARTNSVRWHGHVLRKNKNNFLRRSFDLRVIGTRKRDRAKKTW